jgi:hypothetical protein
MIKYKSTSLQQLQHGWLHRPFHLLTCILLFLLWKRGGGKKSHHLASNLFLLCQEATEKILSLVPEIFLCCPSFRLCLCFVGDEQKKSLSCLQLQFSLSYFVEYIQTFPVTKINFRAFLLVLAVTCLPIYNSKI